MPKIDHCFFQSAAAQSQTFNQGGFGGGFGGSGKLLASVLSSLEKMAYFLSLFMLPLASNAGE